MPLTVISIRQKVPLPAFIWNIWWTVIGTVAAFVPLMVLHICQFPSLVLVKVSRRAFHAYNRVIGKMVWGWWAFGLEYLIGVRFIRSGDEVPFGENAIIIANHQSMADIPVMLTLAARKGRIGDLKWLVKDELKYVPGIGWGLKFLDAVFLKRRWADDVENIARTFARYIELQTPMWLLLFPEGTRANRKKLMEQFNSTPKAGVPKTVHVLSPRPKGFTASVQGLRGFVTAVYDLTIVYQGAQAPSLLQVMRGEIPCVYFHVKRFAIGELPASDQGLADWLNARYLAKDQFIASVPNAEPGIVT